MIKRALILEAAARLFGSHGYSGTTTRLIAREAGVSEVTLFRQFGTKEALLREALGEPPRTVKVARLPDTPENPERELVVWSAAYLRQLRSSRKVIRKSIGEFGDRPKVARRAVSLPAAATRMLREYLERASHLRVLPAEFDVSAAATVLSAVLFADAVGRDLMPGQFPEPAADVHKVYVHFLLGRQSRGAARKIVAKRSSRPGATEATRRSPEVESSTRSNRDRRSPRAGGGAATSIFDRRRTSSPGASSAHVASSQRTRHKT